MTLSEFPAATVTPLAVAPGAPEVEPPPSAPSGASISEVGASHPWTQNPRVPDEPDCEICGLVKDFHGTEAE